MGLGWGLGVWTSANPKLNFKFEGPEHREPHPDFQLVFVLPQDERPTTPVVYDPKPKPKPCETRNPQTSCNHSPTPES